MSGLVSSAPPRLVLVKPWHGGRDQPSSFARHYDDQESLTIPNRGIVLAALLSGLLWAALILTVRAVL